MGKCVCYDYKRPVYEFTGIQEEQELNRRRRGRPCVKKLKVLNGSDGTVVENQSGSLDAIETSQADHLDGDFFPFKESDGVSALELVSELDGNGNNCILVVAFFPLKTN